MVVVFEGAPESTGSYRLHDNRGLLEGAADDVLLGVRKAASNSPGALCRLHDQPGRSLNGADRPKLSDVVDGPLREAGQYLLMDRDTKRTAEFRAILKSAGIASVLLPPKSPNCDAHLERFFKSLKEEALERTIFFSERSLRTAISVYLDHYHAERNHQRLAHLIIEPGAEVGQKAGDVTCQSAWADCSTTTVDKQLEEKATTDLSLMCQPEKPVGPAHRKSRRPSTSRTLTEVPRPQAMFTRFLTSFQYFDHTPYGMTPRSIRFLISSLYSFFLHAG